MSATIEKILDTVNSTILCLDSNKQITYINSTGEILFDTSATSLMGKPFSALLSTLEASTITTKLNEFNGQHQTITEHEARLTLASGRFVSVDYSIYTLDDENSDSQLVVEIRPLDRQVEIARDALSHIQKQASQQFARGVAHEIKNPLSGIRGAAQLLEREISSAGQKEYTDVIIGEVDRLQVLIDNMSSPAASISREPVNILEVLEHIRKLLETAEPDKFNFRRDYDPSIPELMADKRLLIQAFLNIGLNSVQSLEDVGEISFKTRIGRQITIGKNKYPLVVQIDIIDNGPGIATDLADTVFFPMVTNKAEGSGLGLPIAQEIISRHGGIIKFESSPTGTTFNVILPLEQP